MSIIQTIENDIVLLENHLKNSDNQTICKIFKDLKEKYIDFGYKEVVVNDYNGSELIGTKIHYYHDKYREYTEKFIDKLKFLKDHLIDENKKNENEINGINIINNNSNTANSTINQNFDFKTTIEYINEIPDDILDKQLKTELRSILTEIECANEKGKKEKFGKILKWFGEKIADAGFNKFIDYIPNILSYLSKITF